MSGISQHAGGLDESTSNACVVTNHLQNPEQPVVGETPEQQQWVYM